MRLKGVTTSRGEHSAMTCKRTHPSRDILQSARIAALQRRVGMFRRLIVWPMLVGGTALGWMEMSSRACLPLSTVILSTASLELLASYYIAGTLVGTLTWSRIACVGHQLLLVRLWLLGSAGFGSAMLVTVQLLHWRCS